MTTGDPESFEELLIEIINVCFEVDKENESIQLNHVYQLFQAIQVSIKLQDKKNVSRYERVLEIGKKLFDQVRNKASNMDQLKLFIVIQKLLGGSQEL